MNLLRQLFYPFRSGKNSKFAYFAASSLSLLVPRGFYRGQLADLLASIDSRDDAEEIRARAAYYNKLPIAPAIPLPADAQRLRQQKMGRKGQVYFFYTREFLRYFNPDFQWAHIPGDVTFVPNVPSIVKSRPISGSNENAVLLNLNKVRHFLFVRDSVPTDRKRPMACFRGKIYHKPGRVDFFEKWFGKPCVDLGDTSSKMTRKEWMAPLMTIREQLRYRYILAIEGNDVASNLKWVLSSNSIAVMPRPTFETWFQEGCLVPNVHYIEIRPDYADLEDRLAYYNEHPEELDAIRNAAHQWVDRFRNQKREKLISLLVLQNYFRATGQC